MSESRRPSSRPSRWAVLTMPVVTVFCRAKGLPMATTNSPGRRSAEWPSNSAGSFFWGEGGGHGEGGLSCRPLVGPEPDHVQAPGRAVAGAAGQSRQGCRPRQVWLPCGGHETQGWRSQSRGSAPQGPQVSLGRASGVRHRETAQRVERGTASRVTKPSGSVVPDPSENPTKAWTAAPRKCTH